jgi:hypothetical protein
MTKRTRLTLISILNGDRRRNGQRSARPGRSIARGRLTLERLEDRTLATITGTAFGGLNYDPNQGATPPDTIVAAGPNHVVEAVNQNLLFASKANLPNSISGTVQSFQDFFAGMTHSTFGLSDLISDPSVNYDPSTGKWVISILDIDLQNFKGYLDIAVSNSNDPTAGYTKFQINLTDGHGPLIPGNAGSTLWGDFERFGSSATAYVWTVNMFSFSAGGIDQNSLFDHVQVIAIDKSNLSNVHAVDLPSYNSNSGTITNENLLPVRMEGATAADGMWFAEETNYGTTTGQANSLRMVHVANALTAAPADFVAFTGTVPQYSFIPVLDPSGGNHAWNNGDSNANAAQKGSADLIDTNDTRIDSAVWRVVGGQQHLVLTQTVDSVADPGIAKARWYDFNTTNASDPSVLVPLSNSGEINPGAGIFTYFPSADIDPAGDIAMTYLESSASEYLSMYVTGKLLSESTMESSALVAAGNGAYTGPDGSPHRAGDYSGTVVDVNAAGSPVNSFWSANEFSNNGVWGTALVTYSVSTPPPPPGSSVTASTPNGTVAGPVSSFVFTFSQPMDTSSFATAADVDSFTFTPPTGPAVDLTGQITGFRWIDNQHLQVNFAAQSAAGSYRMVIGPQILTVNGTPMDQNQNGTPGEVPADEYTASFAIPVPSPVRNIEDFESSHVYHLVFGPSTFATSSAAAHDGNFGLVNHGGKDWIYRDDSAAQVREGDTISAWVQFHGTADGQAFFAFGANSNIDGSPLATYSLVLAADKRKLFIQENFFGSPLNSTIGTSTQNTRFLANHWYRIQITWGTDGSIVGKLFDSDGTTLLNSVSATASLFSAGGIGFHATGHDKYWDTVTAFVTSSGTSGPHIKTGLGSGGIMSPVLLEDIIGTDLGASYFPRQIVHDLVGSTSGPGIGLGATLNHDSSRDALPLQLETTQKQRSQSHRGSGKGHPATGFAAVTRASLNAETNGQPDGPVGLSLNEDV